MLLTRCSKLINKHQFHCAVSLPMLRLPRSAELGCFCRCAARGGNVLNVDYQLFASILRANPAKDCFQLAAAGFAAAYKLFIVSHIYAYASAAAFGSFFAGLPIFGSNFICAVTV